MLNQEILIKRDEKVLRKDLKINLQTNKSKEEITPQLINQNRDLVVENLNIQIKNIRLLINSVLEVKIKLRVSSCYIDLKMNSKPKSKLS